MRRPPPVPKRFPTALKDIEGLLWDGADRDQYRRTAVATLPSGSLGELTEGGHELRGVAIGIIELVEQPAVSSATANPRDSLRR